MLVKVNHISGRKRIDGREQQYAKVTLLDIDDLGSIIPLRELELWLPPDDKSVARTLKESRYAAIFTRGDKEEDDTIILANGITEIELNSEKEKTINKVNRAQH